MLGAVKILDNIAHDLPDWPADKVSRHQLKLP